MSEKKRVAVYLRHKEKHMDETTSFMTQYEYYKAFAEQRGDWQLAEIYVDEGPAKKQPEFKRLLDDCKRGKIDLIYTKGIANFGRNLVDAIQSTQELSRMKPPIGVFFENECLDSLSKDSVLLLSILLAISFAERQRRSEIQKLAWQRKLDNLSGTKEDDAGDD